MGKKQLRANPTHRAVTKKEHDIIKLSSFDSSTNADHFALVTHGFDRHRLRIFSTLTGNVTNDYASESKERFTSLTWGKIKADVGLGRIETANQGKKTGSALDKVVALGTQIGTVIMFSLAHGTIVKRLTEAHTSPVTDFVLNKSGTKGYSVAEDGYIVEWDIEEEKEVARWKTDAKNTCKLQLSHDEKVLATAGHTISLWDLHQRTWFKKFTGHANEVLNLSFSERDDLLASVAKDDRYVSVWDAQPNTVTSHLASLTLENNVLHLDFAMTDPTLLAVADDGVVGIWQNASSSAIPSATNGNQPSRRKVIRASTRQADTSIRVVSEKDETIPIILARFIIGGDGKSVIIARGTSIKPVFEVVPYVHEETGLLRDNIVLSRQRVVNYLANQESLPTNNLNVGQAYNDSSAAVLGSIDFPVSKSHDENVEEEKTIAQKLEEMAVNDDVVDEPKKKSTKVSAGSLLQTLVQALHSGDNHLLEDCFNNLRKTEAIHNTVKRLPSIHVIPLLFQLIKRFQEKPGRAYQMVRWIRVVLVVHTSYLLTVPDLVGRLSSFYQALDTRSNAFPKLLAMHGYLEVLANNIKSSTSVGEHQDALNVYVEEDSDEEAEARENGIDSMSTDSEVEAEEYESAEGDMDHDEDEDMLMDDDL